MKGFRKTRFQQLHLIITVFSALVVTGICLYLQTGIHTLAVWVSTTIVVFYVIGQIVRLYLQSVLKPLTAETDDVLLSGEIDEASSDADAAYSTVYAEFDESDK